VFQRFIGSIGPGGPTQKRKAMNTKTPFFVTSIGLLLIFNGFLYSAVRYDELFHPNTTTHYMYLSKSLQEEDDHSHPLLPHDDYVYERILNTNSSDYIWVGNHWMPPPGVPTFTPRQLKEYYSRRNILVLGDSTGRRMYTTLYKVMQAADLEDMTVREIDGDPFKRVNVCGKDMGDRYISTLTQHLCLNHTHITEIRDANRNETMIEDLKFDNAAAICYSTLEVKWKDEAFLTGIAKDYDLIIVAMGIWEQVRPWDCRLPNTTVNERLQTSLETMERTNPPGL